MTARPCWVRRPVSSGNWSYTTPALPDGSHSFTAKATDNAGNTTTTSAVTATVNTGQVDTTPPTETISTTINTDTGATTTITSGGVTKDNTLGLSGTVSDAGGVSSVQIYDGATLLGPALLTGSYAAGYAFNESSGTTTADTTGHGITGTLVNGATFTTAGKYGNAVALDGVNDYVDLGNPAALQLTGSMTVSAWINATAFPSDDAAVVSTRDSSEHRLPARYHGRYGSSHDRIQAHQQFRRSHDPLRCDDAATQHLV